MAHAEAKTISTADYILIAESYGSIRSHLTQAADYLYDAVDIIAQFDEVEPTLDLLQSFYDTYKIAYASLSDNSLFINAVRALNSHVLARALDDADESFDSIDHWLGHYGEMDVIPQAFADMSAVAGFTIGADYIA